MTPPLSAQNRNSDPIFAVSIRSSDIGGGADEHSLDDEAPKQPKVEACIICDGGLDLNNLHPSHVEYFGLMKQEAYAKKAELKRQMTTGTASRSTVARTTRVATTPCRCRRCRFPPKRRAAPAAASSFLAIITRTAKTSWAARPITTSSPTSTSATHSHCPPRRDRARRMACFKGVEDPAEKPMGQKRRRKPRKRGVVNGRR